MNLPNYPIFGVSNYKGILPTSWNGQSNFFAVPPGFTIWSDAGNQMWASPNADRSDPVYACMYDLTGALMFQSAIHSAIQGTLSGTT